MRVAPYLILLIIVTAPLWGLSAQEEPAPLPEETKTALVETAKALLGEQKLVVRGKRFNLDCSGLILAIYHGAGIDLSRAYPLYEGNGVRRLYRYLEERQRLHGNKRPQPGDLIFWDNSYDRNGDGDFNDELTHIGMVVSVDAYGTVTYIHHNYTRGIVLEKMNLFRRDVREEQGRRINSAMRSRNAPEAPGGVSLAGELFRTFGRPPRKL